MASALPLACLKSNAVSLLAPPPLILLLLLLLFSLLIAFTVLHVALFIPPPDFHLISSFLPPPDLISSFLPPPDFLSSFLLQGLSSALHLQHQYLAFLLSPCPIFILANLIVFTLLLKSFYPSSLPSHSTSDLSIDHYALPEHFYTAPSHCDFYLPSDHQLCSPEDYHVLSLTNYIEEPPMQDYINMPYVIKGASLQQQIRKPHKEEAQAKLSSKKSEGNLAKMGQERAKGPSKGRSDREPRVAAALSSPAVAKPSIDKLEQSVIIKPSTLINQHEAQAVVVINVETAPPIGCTAGPPPPSQQIIKQTVAVQRPASAAKAAEHQNSKGKKDMQAVVANDGKEALKAKDLGGISAKQAKNHDKRPKDAAIPPNPHMARSHSDHRLSQLSSSAAASANKSMQRARSMKSTRPLSHFQPITSSDPPALTSLDGLSDDEANKRFSDFIANRFALMKREFLECA